MIVIGISFRDITKSVAQAVDCLEEFGVVRPVDFAAEACDVDFQRVGHGLNIVVPDVLQQHVAIDDFVFIPRKKLKKLVLFFS